MTQPTAAIDALSTLRLTVLTPVFNDWDCARHLVENLAQVAEAMRPQPRIELILVDDGSSLRCPEDLAAGIDGRLHKVTLIRLARNLGHQRAISIGLAYAAEEVPCDLLTVMDCDGEDRPQDIPHLIQVCQEQDCSRIVFAARARRSEGLVFRLGYLGYRTLHRSLTGVPVRYGNFSVIPAGLLQSLPLVSETWNHYAAAVLKSRLPCVGEPLSRGTRFAGKSTMNLVSLTMHGVSAMSVFAEVISVRLMVAAIAGALLALLAIALTAWIYSPAVLGGWLILAAVILIAAALLACLILAVFMLGIHAVRGSASFLPKRDYRYFIANIRLLRGGSHQSDTDLAIPLEGNEPGRS